LPCLFDEYSIVKFTCYSISCILNNPGAPNTLGMLDYLNNDQEQLMTQMRTTQHVEEVVTKV